jgi:hypothetical protein
MDCFTYLDILNLVLCFGISDSAARRVACGVTSFGLAYIWPTETAGALTNRLTYYQQNASPYNLIFPSSISARIYI